MAKSWLYPRTVEVRRSKTNAVNGSGVQQVGLVPYSGRDHSTAAADPNGEVVLYSGIAAAIQMRTGGRTRGMMLPADITDKPEWRVLIQAQSAAQYTIRDRDILVDDEGYRYAVSANYWTGFGYQISCIRLET